MSKIAYLANQFPSAFEPYVMEEIDELRHRGVQVIAGSIRKPDAREATRTASEMELGMVLIQSLRLTMLLRAAWMAARRWAQIEDLVKRVVLEGSESPLQRGKALLHTWLGAYYAVLLEDKSIEHIHVHHGYFGSWVAMVAARLLGVGYSMTLHGSDLLLHRAYLDTKLKSCTFCLTVSEYNRRFILQRYPGIEATKVVVARLGVDVPELAGERPALGADPALRFSLLSVGRLQAVKDHAFLVRACAQLQVRGLDFECVIAGEGPERRHLESLIRKHGLEQRVTLVGHVAREQIASLYARADAVVLTSRSEGIPLVLMEAMALGKVVLAPAITGIPELVATGKTGYLYEPGSCGDFVARLLFIYSLGRADLHPFRQSSFPSATRPLDWVAHGAKAIVRHNFNRTKNLEVFAKILVHRTAARTRSLPHEDSLLQQIQLSI